MTKLQILELLELLSYAYPQAYRNKTTADMKRIAEKIYEPIFADLPAEIVVFAVREHVRTNKYPPAISEILERVDALRIDAGGWNIEAMFAELWSAIQGNKKFGELCKANQEYIQNQRALDEMGQADTKMDVVRGQYLKRIPTIITRIQARENAYNALGAETVARMLGEETPPELEGGTA